MSRLGSLARSSALHLAGAFLLMGGWAFFANRLHPMPAPVVAGIVQGGLSAVITLGLKRAVEILSAQFSGLAALAGPPAIAFGISATLLTMLHTASGTPEIGATIAVPLTVSTCYAALYSWGLWQGRRR